MIAVAVRHGTNQGESIGNLGELWEQLADVDAGDGSVNGSKIAAIFARCFGFGVEGVEV
jgi:hypothetical protein